MSQDFTFRDVSMSTRELYHNHGAKALKFVSAQVLDGATYYHAIVLDNYIVCPVCKSKHVIKRGFIVRKIQSVPIGNRSTFLVVKINRVFCPDCNIIRQVAIGCADTNKSYTKRLAQCIVYDSKNMSMIRLSRRYKLD
jgi:transposase